jgi:RNA polymerase sigma-70 factor (ECF subfamily)
METIGTDAERSASIALFARHRDRVRRYLMGRVRDSHVAEDLTQETLMRAVLYSRGLRDPEAAVAWLLRIACHVALDWTRRRARRRDGCAGEQGVEAVDQVQEPSRIELAEDLRVHERWRRRLRHALALLNQLDRVLVVGHYFVGLTCGELATRSGLTRDNVKMRICRARRRLRGFLPDGWGEDWNESPGPLLRRLAARVDRLGEGHGATG